MPTAGSRWVQRLDANSTWAWAIREFVDPHFLWQASPKNNDLEVKPVYTALMNIHNQKMRLRICPQGSRQFLGYKALLEELDARPDLVLGQGVVDLLELWWPGGSVYDMRMPLVRESAYEARLVVFNELVMSGLFSVLAMAKGQIWMLEPIAQMTVAYMATPLIAAHLVFEVDVDILGAVSKQGRPHVSYCLLKSDDLAKGRSSGMSSG